MKMNKGALSQNYQVLPALHEKNVKQNHVLHTCKANVLHLDENIASLWVWLTLEALKNLFTYKDE